MTSRRSRDQDIDDRQIDRFGSMSSALSWVGPRTVIVPRTDQGFGFTLRHFIVYPPESSSDDLPDGEIFVDENDPEARCVKRTKLSSLEPMDTIFVKHVKEGGPASLAGLNTGDRIVSVNGETVTGKSYSQVIGLIQSSVAALKLLVVPKDEDILQMAYQTSVYDKTQDTFRGDTMMTSAAQGNYVKIEHAGIAPTTEVTVTSRRGGWREELRRKYSTPIDENPYENKSERDAKSVSWQGSTCEPLHGDSVNNRNNDGHKASFDIHISYNYPFGKSNLALKSSPQMSPGYNSLYYPVMRKETRTDMVENFGLQSRSNSNSSSSLPSRQSQEYVFQPTYSQDHLNQSQSTWNQNVSDYSRLSQENMSYSSRSAKDRGLVSQEDTWFPAYSSAPRSHTWDSKGTLRQGHDSGDYVPRSLTTSALSKMTNKSVENVPQDASLNSGSNLKSVRYSVSSSTSNLPQNVSPTRLVQYTPPKISLPARSPRNAKSTSADNLQSAGGLSKHRLNTMGQKSSYSVSSSRLKDYREPNISGPTFVVRIGDKVTVSPPHSKNQASENPISINTTHTYPSGTTFALTRAPSGGLSFESKKKTQLPVSERKKQFEANQRAKVESPVISPGQFNYEMSASTKRYKTEIEKLQSLGKLGNIVKRVAHFEAPQSSDSGENTPTRSEQTPPPHQLPQENSFALPQQVYQQQRQSPLQQQQSSPSQQQSGIKFRKIATECYYPSDSPSNSRPTSLGSTLPVRVLIPQSTSVPNSPSVEERKPFDDNTRTGSMCAVDPHEIPVSVLNSPMHMGSVEGTFLSGEKVGSSQSTNRPVRKVSYLSAVNAPICKQVMTASSENLDIADCKTEPSTINISDDTMVPPVSSSSHTNLKSASFPNVIMRKKPEEDEGIKLGRPTDRPTSYLMATRKDRTTLNLPLNKTAAPNSNDMATSPSKHISMKKLKHRFGEKTPRISESSEVNRASQDLNSPVHEVVKEGLLYCKTAITDGKRASDRSWKPFWASLKGHALYLIRDRKDGSWNANDEQLVSIKSCLVDIANDYTKKKHVFRLKTYNGSEYLLQADDQDTMADWIQAIQNNNDPDGDDKGIVLTDFMLRKTNQYDQAAHNPKTSPQTQQKSKKLSGLSFKTKMPYSPNIKRKKIQDDSSRSKTWKGKLKSFRRLGGGGGNSAGEEAAPFGVFGVALEDCAPSPNNQLVPLIVDICTQIVELRGVEVVGIYRVPGNTAAVHMMQDELNRGFENMNTENEKWLDVNVISSLLKAFFRKLSEPLITEDLYQSFITANRAEDPVRRMLSLKRLLHELPEHHFETFKHLAAHLKLVAMHGEQNKMDSRNLAIVFGPTLIRRKDEDMATLVKDMSDQCRIVESIIVNNEWIFSSWDHDNDVPTDEGAVINAPVTESNMLLAKLAEDDRGREFNPRDIVSSIIQAANKKMRGKDRKFLLGALDEDFNAECSPNERNIDQEVARRRAKSEEILTQDTTSESTSTSSSKNWDRQESIPLDHHDTYPFSLSSGTASGSDHVATLATDDYMDWVYVRTHSESQSRSGQQLRQPTLTRQYYSDESLLDKNDELEISHSSLYNSCCQSRERLEDRLWNLEKEARDLREQAERGRREQEKRRIEKQRIEQELARAKKELEMEDRHSLEDLLRHTEFAMQISDFPSRMTALNSRTTGQSDSASLLSEYSTTSSDHKDLKFYLPRPGVVSSRPNRFERADHIQGTSNIGAIHRQITAFGSNLESKEGVGKRAGSLETILDIKCNSGKRGSERRRKGKRDDRNSQPKSPDQLEGKAATLVRNNSVRRGSLDSLRDFYDKQENRSSWASTDSEDGSDLLSSITATFDQKLQILLNPKFKLTGAVKKQLGQVQNTSSAITVSEGMNDKESPRALAYVPPTAAATKIVKAEETKPAKIMPPKVLENCFPQQRMSRLGDLGYDRSFRDPSLHRMHHPDAKIGIASRFERGSTVNSSSSIANVTGVQMSLSTSSLPSGSTIARSIPSRQDGGDLISSSQTGVDQNDCTQKSSGLVKGEAKPFIIRSESRPITKSEKTEVNLSLSKLSREEQIEKAGNEGRHSHDLEQFLTEVSAGSFDDLATKTTKSGAAQASKKKKDRRSARRHTVGGINDCEHFSSLGQLSQSKDDLKLSAWEQLRPAVKERDREESRSVITWLQNERLRMSASDLIGAENRTLSSSCSNLDETRC